LCINVYTGDGELGGGAVWQTYFRLLEHVTSFHLPVEWASRQSSSPALLGSPEAQLVYESGVPDELHFHVPSEAASVPSIHTLLPAAAVTSSVFSAADCTIARCWPAA